MFSPNEDLILEMHSRHSRESNDTKNVKIGVRMKKLRSFNVGGQSTRRRSIRPRVVVCVFI